MHIPLSSTTIITTPHHKTPQLFFLFNETAPTENNTLSLHDALPISVKGWTRSDWFDSTDLVWINLSPNMRNMRSEEHTSELQSRFDLVCRLLLEKKNTNMQQTLRALLCVASFLALSPTRDT